MIKAYKLDKEIKRVIKEEKSLCDKKLVRADKLLNYGLILFVVLIPVLMITVYKINGDVPTYGISDLSLIIYTILFIILTYKESLYYGKYSKRHLLIDQYKVSYVSWRLYKVIKIFLFPIVLGIILYVVDYFGIIKVYTEYYEHDGFSLFKFPLYVVFQAILCVVFDTLYNMYFKYGSSIGKTFISIGVSSILVANFIRVFFIGVFNEDLYDDLDNIEYSEIAHIRISEFKLLDSDSVTAILAGLLAILMLLIFLVISKRAVRRMAYGV